MARHISKSRALVGLDIEPSAIHAAQVTVNGGLVVAKAASTPLEPGIVREGDVADVDALAEALRVLFREHQLDKRVRIGIANQQIVVRTIELPPIEDRKELDAAVRFTAQDELPMRLEDAILDYQPLGLAETAVGPRQRVVVVAARREMVDRILSAALAAGLRPEGIDLSAFAMLRALAGPEDELGLFVSVGGLTNIALARGRECLFTRAAGIGLEAAAIELAERHALTLEHARGWLAVVGLEAPLDEIEGDTALAAESRSTLTEYVRRIAVEVRNSLDFHAGQDVLGGGSIRRAVLTGPALSIPGFAPALEAQLGLPVQEGTVKGEPDDDGGRYAVAAGLAVEEAPGA